MQIVTNGYKRFSDQLDRYKATCSLQLTNYLDIDFPFSYKQILLDVGKLFYFFYVRREAEVFEGCDVIKVNYPGCFVHLKKLGKRILSVYKFAQWGTQRDARWKL